MIVRTAAPSTLAIAAATRKYRFHSRLARASHTWRRYDVRQDAGQLRVGVVHVEDFIMQDLFENGARLRVVVDELPIDREAAGGGFFRHVQEGEQTMVGLVLDRQVVQPVAAGKGSPVEERAQVRSNACGEGRRLADGRDRRDATRRLRARGRDDAAAGLGLTRPRAGCHVRHPTRLRRMRAACAHGGRNRSTPIGEPGAGSDPAWPLARLEAYRLRERRD